MTDQRVIKMEVWPFNGVGSASGLKEGPGAENDQKMAGPCKREFSVTADNIRSALAAADLIVEGIKSSGHVWEVRITSIEGKKLS